MNWGAFKKNVLHSLKICPSLKDSWSWLNWTYGILPPSQGGEREIHFKYDPPIGSFELSVRNNGGADAFIFSEIFDHQAYGMQLPFQPQTILDIGAYTGMATLFFSRKYPGVPLAAVEPIPDQVTLLEKNLKWNGIKAQIIPKAIAIQDGHLSMSLASKDYGHRVVGIDSDVPLTNRQITVPSISMTSLLRLLSWERIGLLKLDIEGYESVLLTQNNDWLSQVDAICMEHHEAFKWNQVELLARTWGFKSLQDWKGNALLIRKGFV